MLKISLNKSVKPKVKKHFLLSLGTTNECKNQVVVHSVGYPINEWRDQWLVVRWEDFVILYNSDSVEQNLDHCH